MFKHVISSLGDDVISHDPKITDCPMTHFSAWVVSSVSTFIFFNCVGGNENLKYECVSVVVCVWESRLLADVPRRHLISACHSIVDKKICLSFLSRVYEINKKHKLTTEPFPRIIMRFSNYDKINKKNLAKIAKRFHSTGSHSSKCQKG